MEETFMENIDGGTSKQGVADYTPTLIRDMDVADRPREKALRLGVKALSDAELMALVFATGIKGKSVIELCSDILKDNNWHLSEITKMTPQKLSARYKGIGIAKSTTLLAVLELGARAERDRNLKDNPVINNSQIAYEVMRPRLLNIQHEEFWILLINRGGKIIEDVQISKGGTAATTVDVKIIMKAALMNSASCILLFHNHPSGTLRPSPEDDRLTRKIVDAAKFFDILVSDHIIIADGGYYSYADNGRM